MTWLSHTHTRLTALFSGTTRVSLYKKGKTNLDFTEAIDSEWQWHQLGHMQVCTSLQTDNHANTHHSVFLQAGTTQFFTGQMLFLPPNQQRQSTEGTGYQRVNIAPDYTHTHTRLTALFPGLPR